MQNCINSKLKWHLIQLPCFVSWPSLIFTSKLYKICRYVFQKIIQVHESNNAISMYTQRLHYCMIHNKTESLLMKRKKYFRFYLITQSNTVFGPIILKIDSFMFFEMIITNIRQCCCYHQEALIILLIQIYPKIIIKYANISRYCQNSVCD